MSNEVLPPASAERFRVDRLITSILGCIRSGKEASVWCCRAHPSTGHRFFALKAYRSFDRRSFHNDAIYRTGRIARETRWDKAITQRSAFGLRIACATWVEEEEKALLMLHAAGVDVPRPIARTEDALLMEYLGDDERPAQQLREVESDPVTAAKWWQQLLRSIAIALSCNRIHADLSPYNLLLWRDRIWLIDLPQSVDARCNAAAQDLLQRDVRNAARWFQRQGCTIDPDQCAAHLWNGWVLGQVPVDR